MPVRLSEHADKISRRVAIQLSLIVTAIFTLIISASAYFTTTESIKSLVDGQIGNYAYWIQVGDTFQIKRSIDLITTNSPIISARLFESASGLVISEASRDLESGPLPMLNVSSRHVFPISDQDHNSVGRLEIRYLIPLTSLFMALVFALCILGTSWLFFRQKARAAIETLNSPLRAFLQRTKEAATIEDLAKFEVDASEIDEFNELGSVIRQMGDRIHGAELKVRETEKEKAVYQVTRQVAHDIKSPLAALKLVARMEAQKSSETSHLLSSAIGRIEKIAEDVLNQSRATKPRATEGDFEQLLSILKDTVEMKRAEYQKNHQINLQINVNRPLGPILFCSSTLARIISNLINNAVEASTAAKAPITIEASESPLAITIAVRDQGLGIPTEILQTLGREGVSTKGASGNGFGLWHARESVRSWNGQFEIESKVGTGTLVKIHLPFRKQPTLQDQIL